MAADTSIVPSGFTVTSACCQYVIGRDNGLTDQLDKSRLVPPYTNSDAARTLFLAHLSSPERTGFEASEGFSVGQESPFTITFAATTAVISSISGITGDPLLFIRSSNYLTDSTYRSFGRYGAYGNPGDPNPTAPLYSNGWQWMEAETQWKITFSPAIKALGFYAVDLGDWTGSLRLKLYFSDLTTETIDPAYSLGAEGKAPWNQSMTYIGLLTTMGVTRIDFLNTDNWDKFGYDEFTVAVSNDITIAPPPVPTPTGLASCGPSLGPASCPQTCTIPVPTWSPQAYSIVTSALPTGLATCGPSLGRQTC